MITLIKQMGLSKFKYNIIKLDTSEIQKPTGWITATDEIVEKLNAHMLYWDGGKLIENTNPTEFDAKCITSYKKRILRKQREEECFPIINRGQLWYNTLSDEQKSELAEWYEAWLNVTETLKTPIKPDWLN